jgi:4-hydroxymandelate oxidase
MRCSPDKTRSRRKFLRMLAGSPLLASGGLIYGPLAKLLAAEAPDDRRAFALLDDIAQGADLISSPDKALEVMDFEPVARKVLPPAHFGYLATGVDDDATIRANREGFNKFQIRSRRLVDVSKIDMGIRLFGTAWETPLVICPVGSQKAFHPEGEIAVAKAARAKGHLQILSTVSSSSVEDVTAARGAPIWFQLYTNNDWNVVRGMVKRAEAAGCPAVVVTVDLQDGSNRETLARSERADSRQCASCHTGGLAASARRRPIFEGLDVSKVNSTYWAGNDWSLVKRLRDAVSMKVLLKGIVAREDAQLAVENGVDGLIVSNHGGRAENTLRSTIESLPEVLEGAAGRIPVLVDGGFRRGTDAFKALGLGAAAVGFGRPYIWGLASFGQAGVEAVLAIMRRELQTIMREAGTASVEKITHAYIISR